VSYTSGAASGIGGTCRATGHWHHAHAVDDPVRAVGQADMRGATANQADHHRLDHGQCELAGHGGIDRVAAAREHFRAGRRGERMVGHHHAAAAGGRLLLTGENGGGVVAPVGFAHCGVPPSHPEKDCHGAALRTIRARAGKRCARRADRKILGVQRFQQMRVGGLAEPLQRSITVRPRPGPSPRSTAACTARPVNSAGATSQAIAQASCWAVPAPPSRRDGGTDAMMSQAARSIRRRCGRATPPAAPAAQRLRGQFQRRQRHGRPQASPRPAPSGSFQA